MKSKKRTAKRAVVSKNRKRLEAAGTRRAGRSQASARYLPDELAGMFKPVKKPVTLRLDADILAWFQRGGRGYQTRINQVLRKLMMAEGKGSRSRG